MVTENFDTEFIYTCPCFLDIIFSAVSTCEKNDTTIYFMDFVFARHRCDVFAAETFTSDKILLFSCAKHLVEWFCFRFLHV